MAEFVFVQMVVICVDMAACRDTDNRNLVEEPLFGIKAAKDSLYEMRGGSTVRSQHRYQEAFLD